MSSHFWEWGLWEGWLSESMMISPLFLNTICSLIKKCPSDFFCNTHYAQSSLAAVAKKSVPQTLLLAHTGSGDEALSQSSTKLFGEGRASIFCSATDLIHAGYRGGTGVQGGRGSRQSLPGHCTYIPTVVGNCSCNNNCTNTSMSKWPGASTHPILHVQTSIRRAQMLPKPW